MKNIHILSTDKPSRLCKNELGKFYLTELMESKISYFTNQNIYITSDEEIKEGDWFIWMNNKVINQAETDLDIINKHLKNGDVKKIILTTDQDLIKDGVQDIDDEFLEWFVKNPSCDKVVVTPYLKDIINSLTNEKYPVIQHRHFDETKMICTYDYELIIPKEEPKQSVQEYEQQGLEKYAYELKQETLEEAAERLTEGVYQNDTWEEGRLKRQGYYQGIIDGAKWQQERSYSEEEVIDILVEFSAELKNISNITKWFEQFKKK